MSAADFKISTETLDPSDPRDALIAAVNADCKRIREMAWALRPVCSRFLELRNRATAGVEKVNIDELLAAQNEFTLAEHNLTLLVEDVERRVHAFNCGRTPQERIYLAHNAEGLPIRVDKTRKTMIFG